MAELGGNRKRFTSPLNTIATTGAQQLLLKPVVWSQLTVHVHGEQNLEGVEEPFIVIANHSSHFDGPLIMSALPRRLSKNLATGAAADTFFTKWQNAALIQLFMNGFPVNRAGTRSHRGMAKQLLSEGVPIFLFPEGTRSRTGGMGPFTPGVAALAISFNCQVVPSAIVGAFAAWPAKEPRWRPGRPPPERRSEPATPVSGQDGSLSSMESMSSICSSLNSKSKMSRFSAMRCGCDERGIATSPCWMCQRSTTWAGVRPLASAISWTTWSVRSSAWPSGL